ncbi:SnoaL-like domain-containing protein [Bdellovibrio bacteriovorus]|nr:hypothetical protein Bb109J_c1246 [Bdellovibrio bacteriovorus]
MADTIGKRNVPCERKINKRIKLEKVALYTVRDGKIIKEEFFYTM